jgi:hypothetical protein
MEGHQAPIYDTSTKVREYGISFIQYFAKFALLVSPFHFAKYMLLFFYWLFCQVGFTTFAKSILSCYTVDIAQLLSPCCQVLFTCGLPKSKCIFWFVKPSIPFFLSFVVDLMAVQA